MLFAAPSLQTSSRAQENYDAQSDWERNRESKWPWCGPCKIVAPDFHEVARETAGKFVLAKVNTEEVSTLAARFRMTAIPTIIVFDHGLEIAPGRCDACAAHPEIHRASAAESKVTLLR